MIRTAVTNQAEIIAKQTFTAYKQKLRAAVRQPIIDLLMTASLEEGDKLFGKYKNILISQQSDDLFAEQFPIEEQVSSTQALKDLKEKWENQLKLCEPDTTLLTQAQNNLSNILKEAEVDRYLPTYVLTHTSDRQELQLEQEQEQELELELYSDSTRVYRDWETDRKSTRLNSSH